MPSDPLTPAGDPGDPIDPIIAELSSIIVQAEAEASRIGYFAALYRRVTVAVREQLQSFEDPARLARLDVIFARRYLDALAAWRVRQPCSACWKVAFDTTRLNKPIILQHLLLGINAHINLDLGIACARTSPGDQHAEDGREPPRCCRAHPRLGVRPHHDFRNGCSSGQSPCSSIFLTSFMKWSASAPSTSRWS